MKKLVLIYILAAPSLYAQQTVANKNLVYAEGLGNSIIYSFNYERILVTGMFQFSARAGFGIFPIASTVDYIEFADSLIIHDEQVKTTFALPVELIGAVGKTKHKFEISFGFTSFIEYYSRLQRYPPWGPIPNETYNERVLGYFFSLNPGLAYRYERPQGGFFMRIGIVGTMLFRNGKLDDSFPILPYPKICLGYKFKPPGKK